MPVDPAVAPTDAPPPRLVWLMGLTNLAYGFAYAAILLTMLPMRLVAVPEGRFLLFFWLALRFTLFAAVLAILWWMLALTSAEKEGVRNRLTWLGARKPLPIEASTASV